MSETIKIEQLIAHHGDSTNIGNYSDWKAFRKLFKFGQLLGNDLGSTLFWKFIRWKIRDNGFCRFVAFRMPHLQNVRCQRTKNWKWIAQLKPIEDPTIKAGIAISSMEFENYWADYRRRDISGFWGAWSSWGGLAYSQVELECCSERDLVVVRVSLLRKKRFVRYAIDFHKGLIVLLTNTKVVTSRMSNGRVWFMIIIIIITQLSDALWNLGSLHAQYWRA